MSSIGLGGAGGGRGGGVRPQDSQSAAPWELVYRPQAPEAGTRRRRRSPAPSCSRALAGEPAVAERLSAALQRGASPFLTAHVEDGCAPGGGVPDLSNLGRRKRRCLKLDFDPMGLLARRRRLIGVKVI